MQRSLWRVFFSVVKPSILVVLFCFKKEGGGGCGHCNETVPCFLLRALGYVCQLTFPTICENLNKTTGVSTNAGTFVFSFVLI